MSTKGIQSIKSIKVVHHMASLLFRLIFKKKINLNLVKGRLAIKKGQIVSFITIYYLSD